MHNREITHIVKAEFIKNQMVVRTKCSFCCHLRETYVQTKIKVFMKPQCKAIIDTLKIRII